MSLVGTPQMLRNVGKTASNNFTEIEISSKWLLQSPSFPQSISNNNRNMQRSLKTSGGGGGGGISSSMEFPLEPPSPPRNASLITSLRKAKDSWSSHHEYNPRSLDPMSFDTELIPELPDNRLYDGPSLNQRVRVKSLGKSDTYPAANRTASRTNPVAKIKVVVRKRPLNRKEMAKEEADIITMERNSTALTVHETKHKVDLTEYVERHGFLFDAVLDETVSNDKVYTETVKPIVPLIFQETKATCFAYGQTGSGKTHTMQPLPLRASRDILTIMQNTYKHKGYQLFVSFFEIYRGKLFDLLNDRKSLSMREDGKKQVCIGGLEEFQVSDTETIMDLIVKGNAARSKGITGANEESSRSHAILQLVIKRSTNSSELKSPQVVGKLSFIDLAGSERGADTIDTDKQTRIEGAEINKSLLALKECIRALGNDQNHIPFRGSKLTEVLRDSFVGNSRTVMISCVSPNSASCEHTLNTLRYADRVKSLSKGNNSKKGSPKDSPRPRISRSTLKRNLEGTKVSGLNGSNKFGRARGFEKDVTASPTSSPVVKRVHRGRENELQSKLKDPCDFHANNASSDDNLDLIALLKEEEELVAAHKRLLEENMELVKEDMNMLIEADTPGNQLDDYMAKLNSVLTQKAEGILRLQTQLANFKRRLNGRSILISSSRP